MSVQQVDSRPTRIGAVVRRRSHFRDALQAVLDPADVRLNGDRPWDLQVHHSAFYRRVLSNGSLGLGESYMDGWWDCPALDEFFHRVLRTDVYRNVRHSVRAIAYGLLARLLNLQTKARASVAGRRHYDLGNDLFGVMLDQRMVYSCAYWKNASTLDEAQEAKLDLICRKIGLGPGQTVLDIGCGWGSFARYAAENCGANVVGNTVSKEQAEWARQRCAGLPVTIRLQDYRDVRETFDHVVSVGMFEHVGYKNHRTYMETVHRCLKNDGLFLLHTITRNESGHTTDPWIHRYIFPNGLLPSPVQITTAAEGLFVVEDVHGFGPDYDRTLMAWCRNFVSGWPRIAERYGERFFRMWTYYLLCCAGSFRARSINLWQLVLSKRGLSGGYVSVR